MKFWLNFSSLAELFLLTLFFYGKKKKKKRNKIGFHELFNTFLISSKDAISDGEWMNSPFCTGVSLEQVKH